MKKMAIFTAILVLSMNLCASSFDQEYKKIINRTYEAVNTQDTFIEQWHTGIDNVSRPYLIYIPSGYTSIKKTPVFINLHGGVNRSSIRTKRVKRARRNKFLKLAQDNNWIMIFPYGQQGATWWDHVGMSNLENILKKVKDRFNVDDNRVFMGGFSDGASGSFHYAMVRPTSFAAFLAFNGHVGVGGLSGGHQLYPRNLRFRPVRVTSTDLDYFYPTKMIEPMIKFVQSLGANVLYQKYFNIGHEFDFNIEEIPKSESFLKQQQRIPYPLKLEWKTSDPQFGKFHWIDIHTINNEEKSIWHEDFNHNVASERFSFGITLDENYQGEGVKIFRVKEESLGEKLNLKKDDLIIRINNKTINTPNQLWDSQVPIGGGHSFEITYLRNGQTLKSFSKTPDVAFYDLFNRKKRSGAVRAHKVDNTFNIETSNVSSFSIKIHPEYINYAIPVTITLNGKRIYRKKVVPQIKVLQDSWNEYFDRELLYSNIIKVIDGEVSE
jgi:predicted esterase